MNRSWVIFNEPWVYNEYSDKHKCAKEFSRLRKKNLQIKIRSAINAIWYPFYNNMDE